MRKIKSVYFAKLSFEFSFVWFIQFKYIQDTQIKGAKTTKSVNNNRPSSGTKIE